MANSSYLHHWAQYVAEGLLPTTTSFFPTIFCDGIMATAYPRLLSSLTLAFFSTSLCWALRNVPPAQHQVRTENWRSHRAPPSLISSGQGCTSSSLQHDGVRRHGKGSCISQGDESYPRGGNYPSSVNIGSPRQEGESSAYPLSRVYRNIVLVPLN